MDIKVLHDKIINNNIINTLIMFKNTNKFLINQYISAICSIRKVTPYYTDTFDFEVEPLFQDDSIQTIVVVDKFTSKNKKLLDRKNLFVIYQSISDESYDIFKNNIIDFPLFDATMNWMIVDYIASKCLKLSSEEAEWLAKSCEYDIDKVLTEVNKILAFDIDKQHLAFEYVKDQIMLEHSNYTVFDFIDSIICKDIKRISDLLTHSEVIDIDGYGIISLLHNQFLNIIKVQLTNNPTVENTGLKSPKQIYALKNKAGKYSSKSLAKIFSIITDADYLVKTGLLGVDIIRDYLLIKILGVEYENCDIHR